MNRWGQSNTERGQELMRAVRMAWQRRAGTQPAEQGHCRRTQPADNLPGTGLTETTASSWPTSQQTTAADDVGRPLAVQCSLVEGVRWCWPLRRRAQTYLIVCLHPTNRLCLSLSLPTPLICKNQFSPNFFFVVIFISLPLLLPHSKFVP